MLVHMYTLTLHPEGIWKLRARNFASKKGYGRWWFAEHKKELDLYKFLSHQQDFKIFLSAFEENLYDASLFMR